MSFRRCTIAMVALTATALLAPACQTGSVSVEEAKRISTQAAEVPFVPPPPTIDDVLALLEQGPAPEWRDRVTSDRALAARPEPGPAVQPYERINFLYGRGIAAANSGRVGQALSDFTRAVEISTGQSGSGAERVQNALADAHWFGGSAPAHLRYRRDSLAGAPEGAKVARYAGLASTFALAGDVTSADSAIRDAAGSPLSALDSILPSSANAPLIPVVRAYFEWGIAEVLAAHGKYREAQEVFRQAAAEIDASIALGRQTTDYMSISTIDDAKPRAKGTIHESASRNLRLQGRLLEAEVEARLAVRTFANRWGRDNQYTASGVVALGVALLAQGRGLDAEKLARVALGIYDSAGALPEALRRAQARGALAAALGLQEKWRDALTEFETIEQDMAKDPQSLEQFFRGDLDWALALTRTGQAKQAAERLRPVVGQLGQRLGSRDLQVAEARGVLGMALAASGDGGAALREFQAAVPALLASSRGAATEGGSVALRERRLRGILEVNITTLSQAPMPEHIAEAFRLGDAARGRAVQRAVGAGAARAAARDPGLADLVRRDQDAEKQLGTLYRQLADLTIRPKDPKDRKDARPAPEAVRAQIDQLVRARTAFADEIATKFPAYADLTDPKPTTVEEVRRALRDGEALIAMFVGRERSFVWAVPKAGAPVFAVVPLTAAQVAAMVGRLRTSLTPVGGTLAEQPTFDAATAFDLYGAFLKPVEAGWRGATQLIVVPHGALGELPLAVLLTAPPSPAAAGGVPFAQYRNLPFLVRQVAVTQLPAVASLKILRSLPAGSATRRPFVGFGDPWFNQEQARRGGAEQAGATASAQAGAVGVRSAVMGRVGVDRAQLGQLPRLPDTAEEIRAMGQTLGADPSRDIHLGREANTRAVKTLDLGDYRVVAFATHGLTPGALEGLTQPALALSAPDVAGVDGDGLLTMEDILGLRLNADWVVLSACDTAAGQGAGAEAVSGLGRAFFYAGTRAVLVTQWSVETTSARALTTELFRRQVEDATLTRAEALRQAMLALIDGPGYVNPQTKQDIFSYAHPMFWAPFTLVGDGGSRP